MSKDFDISGIDDFASEMLDLAERKMPNETRKFMMREGNKLRKLTANQAKSSVKKQTGSYLKGIKRGKVYDYNGMKSIRVYNSSPHAHLIEEGHRMVTPSGREVGFVRGQKVFAKVRAEFVDQFANDTEEFIDELLDKGLK